MNYPKIKTSTIISVVSILLIILIPMIVNAQPPEPEGDPDVPIDGGVSLLVAAGIGYGAKKLRDARRNVKMRKCENEEM